MKHHNPRRLALSPNRLAIQIIKVTTSTLVKRCTSTPRKEHVSRLRILVLGEIILAVPSRLNGEIELELEVIRNVPDSIKLIAKKAILVESENNTLCIADSKSFDLEYWRDKWTL